jgi:ABC-type bacteriocin/lantibiotic exporter with double-glycine peptidase domain
VLILIASLGGFPPPLITRYLVDEVILGQQLGLLAAAIVLLIGFLVAEKLVRMLEEFYFARFKQRITLDIHRDLIAKVLRFPKSFLMTIRPATSCRAFQKTLRESAGSFPAQLFISSAM